MRATRTSVASLVVAQGGQERGIALIAALLIMLLMSALMIGFTTVVMSDQRYRGIDKDRARAFYGAQSGLEKLSTDFGNLFLTNVAPTAQNVTDLSLTPPAIPNVTFVAPAGVTAYGVKLIPCDQLGNTKCNGAIGSGPYVGLIALKQVYNLDAVARTASGGEAHLTRKIESVAIPLFQFGIFSDVDLSFFAGPLFNFGGRVHTNGNLFLAEGNGNTLTLTDKVTAVKQVVRKYMQNQVLITDTNFGGAHDGIIKMANAPGAYRNLLYDEGSVKDGIWPVVANSPKDWGVISGTTYASYIRNGATGAKPLNLDLITAGGTNADMTRRPALLPTPELATSVLYGERMFGKTSLRILLSDVATDITSLPTVVTATAPVRLGDEVGAGVNATSNDWRLVAPNNGTPYGPVDATHPPIARSPGLWTVNTTANTVVPGAPPAGNITVLAGSIPVGVVAGQSNVFHVPVWPLAITTNLNAPLATINCSSVTPTVFTNCKTSTAVVLPAVPAGSLVKTTVNGTPYSGVTIGNQTAGATVNSLKTYTVSAAQMMPFATNELWLNNKLVTCSGLDSGLGILPVAGNTTTTFTNCLGTPATNFPATLSTQAVVGQNVGLIGGFLKIEMQKADLSGWQDVTMEILNWGFGAPNQVGFACPDPTPNAIVRFQRLRDNGSNASCSVAGSLDSYDYWPNTLFDTREALLRDVAPAAPNAANVQLGGVIHYVTLDVANLVKWFKGTAPYAATGTNALAINGYSVYFSDRRNNRADGTNGTTLNRETGEYGLEDIVNPNSITGLPMSGGVPDAGEDVNLNNALDVYGQFPVFNGTQNAVPATVVAAFNNVGAAAVRPWSFMTPQQAITNRPFLFRRALKLVRGGLASLNTTQGLTVVAENPVYIQGDWNFDAASYAAAQAGTAQAAHSETSVVADAVTLLSNAWTDWNSFANPYVPGNRARADSYYRLAIIAGKGMAFPYPGAPAGNPPNDFGTDGGAHNFLRYLEGNGGVLNYRGAIATFYYNRQAVGIYKCCATVYSPPTRNYNFDTDFLDPAKLPPLTPVFRDINALGFSQEIRPGK